MRRDRPALFKGRHFEPEIIILCVRRYLRYALSLRNLEEIMAERNVHVDHVTIWRWIQYYAPELSRRCRRELRNTNGSWRVDETYLRVAGKWTYLYRAVDSTGDTIDFLLSPKRDAAAAKRFFQKALRSPNHPRPRVVNVDGNRLCCSNAPVANHEVRAARQIEPRFRPKWAGIRNCPLMIFCTNSIPISTRRALENFLNPSIGCMRNFTLRWSCSTILFK